jgi:pimeloyl-ACP methyl ester carboxylesterase
MKPPRHAMQTRPTLVFACAHFTDERLFAHHLMASMARSIGVRGQFNQQQAMLARPDSHADLRTVRVPTLIACGREDAATPLADHERMRECVPDARLEVFDQCGHLSTIERPDLVNALLSRWLTDTRIP